MPEAVRAVIRFGFEVVELKRIEARCIVENTASARVMEKAGMTFEGILRQREFVKGSYRDVKMYSILRDEYLERKAAPWCAAFYRVPLAIRTIPRTPPR